MKDRIEQLRKEFQHELSTITQGKDVELLQIKYLGKKGSIQQMMISLKDASQDLRPLLGKEINILKQECEQLLSIAAEALQQKELVERIEKEKIDITAPGRRQRYAAKHPLTMMRDEILSVLHLMGFAVQYGPDMDSDYYNYEGLNFPPDHPARDMQDTFYITRDLLLRSHTSNTQLRVMENHKPPIRIAAPGTVYRNETISARSHVFFHQIEGLYVDEEVSFVDLLSTMEEFWTKLFHKKITTRFRPSYFPFVEPGLEIDISCTACGGAGCRLCKSTGWLEVAGAGMVHPEVLRNGGIDPESYSGFAFGMGVERLAMLRYGVKDVRVFAENDLRFLQQF